MRKLVKQEAEAAKVSIRHARKVALDALKTTPSEDTRRQLEKQVSMFKTMHAPGWRDCHNLSSSWRPISKS